MAWVLWTDKGLGESLIGNIRHHRQAFLHEMQYKTSTFPLDVYGSDDESDGESEMEWDGWMRDLERQGRVKQRSEKVCRSAASASRQQIPSNVSSQLPSPPLSEASPSGSPRPSISMPHAAMGSLSSHAHARYPNIGNVIGAHGYRCTEHPYSPEKVKCTTISTVSVGMASSSRRRSSTVSTEVTHDKSRFSSMSASSARANARSVSTSAGVPCPPRTPVRHAHSSSNLRITSPLYESDAAAVPSSPSKRQNAFMRGMTLRAGKIVKGLESAIDFVDEKTV